MFGLNIILWQYFFCIILIKYGIQSYMYYVVGKIKLSCDYSQCYQTLYFYRPTANCPITKLVELEINCIFN